MVDKRENADIEFEVQLNTPLQYLLREFSEWWRQEQLAADRSDSITEPLYHYTNAAGLAGILASQEIWFTSISHLNDPSELKYGIETAIAVLREESALANGPVRLMCQKMDLVLAADLSSSFGFYTASFSRNGDDLGQWRAYGDNGAGCALGLAPHLFHRKEAAGEEPHQKIFLSSMNYDVNVLRARIRDAIRRAISVVSRGQTLVRDQIEGREFLKKVSVELSIVLLWHSLTSKHPAYKHEDEVRLMIVGEVENLKPYVEMRTRGAEIVPFIRSPMMLRGDGNIKEIVVGPTAKATASDDIKNLLVSYEINTGEIVRKSDIPYRA